MADDRLEPITRSPLYEQVVERLRGLIEGLEPGDRLMSERELAERLGVSRTSVRQALTVLRVLGLVEIRHGDGVYVLRSPSDLIPTLAVEVASSEVDNSMVWEVREAIEVQAARLAARRRSDDDLDRMRVALGSMTEAVDRGDEGLEPDRRFHQAIADAAHNPLLRQLFHQLQETIDRTSEASLSQAGRPTVSLRGHQEILAAIEARDEADAADRMHRHVMTSGESVYSEGAADARP